MFNIQGWVEVRFRSWEYTKQLILVLLFVSYGVIFHTNNCKPTFPIPIYDQKSKNEIKITFIIPKYQIHMTNSTKMFKASTLECKNC